MLNKFEEELKSAILFQRIKKQDFFDSPLRHGYLIVSQGGETLYLLDLIKYMHSSEKHVIKCMSLISGKEYPLNPAKITVRNSEEASQHMKNNLDKHIDTGRSLSIDYITLYLGNKEYEGVPKLLVRKK